MNKNILVIESRKFFIFNSVENENDINTTDTVIDNIEYSIESTDCESVEIFYITTKPDFEALGYAIEV